MCQAKNEIPQQSDEWKTEIFTKMNGKSNNKKKESYKRRNRNEKREEKNTHSSNEENIYDKF